MTPEEILYQKFRELGFSHQHSRELALKVEEMEEREEYLLSN